MSPKEENEILHEWFSLQGWKIMKERLELIRATDSRIEEINTVEQLHFKKGVVNNVDWLLGFPDLVRMVLEDPDADNA